MYAYYDHCPCESWLISNDAGLGSLAQNLLLSGLLNTNGGSSSSPITKRPNLVPDGVIYFHRSTSFEGDRSIQDRDARGHQEGGSNTRYHVSCIERIDGWLGIFCTK